MDARAVITHVVVISQENRTYDDLFGGFGGGPTAYPGGDGTLPSAIVPEVVSGGFDTDPPKNAHDWFRCLQVNNFSAATWISIKHGVWPQSPAACPTTPPPYNPDANSRDDSSALTIVDDTHRAAYVALARQFEISDNYFAVQDGDSFSGHQFIVALHSHNDLNEIISGTPTRGNDFLTCGSLATGNDVHTPVLNRVTGFTNWQDEGTTGYCWNGATFGDNLNAAQITWRHYSTDRGGVFNGFVNFQAWFPRTDPSTAGSHFRISLDDLQRDINNNDLPQFTWVKPPCIALSDHPGATHDPFGGSDWVASVVNSIGNNPALWPHTVIFVVWDDWGGFYDHAIPPAPGSGFDDALTPGLRQPFIAISAYERTPGSVMHSYTTYASVFRFTEDLFNLPPLNSLDANAYGLREYFDFHKQPNAFTPIAYSEPGFDARTACTKYISIPLSQVDR